MPRTRERKADVERRREQKRRHRVLRHACGTLRASRCVLDAVREGLELVTRPAGKSFALEVKGRPGALLRRPTLEAIQAAIEAAREVLALGAGECPPCDAPLTEAELERRRRTRIVTPQRREGEAARYEVVDAAGLVASHDPRSLRPDPRYPADVQERVYHLDENEQRKVVLGAQNLDPTIVLASTPTAVDGPPIATEDGIVLGGNARSMMIKLAYLEHPEKAAAYRDALIARAPEFGFTSANVERFDRPILVRVVEGFTRHSPKAELSAAVRRYNEGLTNALDAKAKAVAQARQLSDATVQKLGELLLAHEDESLRDVMRSEPRVFLEALEADGIVTSTDRAKYATPAGHLTEIAKDEIEGMFLGRVLGSADRLRSTAPSLLAKVERAVPGLVRVAGVNPGLDLIPTVRAAIDLLNDARARGLALDELVNQGSLFGSSAVDPRVLALARLFDGEKPRALGDRFKAWAKTASEDPSQPSMFWTPPTPEGAFQVLAGRVPNPFHAGDGGTGRDTFLGAMTLWRGTGHFGTGTYYVASKQQLLSGALGHRPVQEVSFSGLKLYRPQNDAQAQALHDVLRRVNDAVHGYERPGMPLEVREREDTPDDYWEAWLRRTDRMAADLGRLGVRVGAEQLRSILEDAAEDLARGRETEPSASTRVMVAAGFQGVDVTHLPEFDNTMYGSVVYGDPMPRKQNPPTTRDIVEVRELFERERQRALSEGDRDRASKLDLLREYFTSPEARKQLEKFVFELNREGNPSVSDVVEKVKAAGRHVKEIATPLVRGAGESAKVAAAKAKAKFCEECRKSCSERATNPCSCRLRVKNPGELRVTVVRNNEGRSALALVRLDAKGAVKEFEAVGEPKKSSHEAAIDAARSLAKKLHLPLEVDGVVELAGRERNPSYAPIVRSRAKSTEALAAELRPRLKHRRAGAVYVQAPFGLLRLELEDGKPKTCAINGRPRADVCKALREDLAALVEKPKKSTTRGRPRAPKES